jgi:hypothetical protein
MTAFTRIEREVRSRKSSSDMPAPRSALRNASSVVRPMRLRVESIASSSSARDGSMINCRARESSSNSSRISRIVALPASAESSRRSSGVSSDSAIAPRRASLRAR